MNDEELSDEEAFEDMSKLLAVLKLANSGAHDLASLRAAAIEVVMNVGGDSQEAAELVVDLAIESVKLVKKVWSLA